MSALKGDFIGFELGPIHSSELGIMRVSDGSRYTEDLLPNFQDKTEQIVGGDGTYYWDSYFSYKPITIQFAFDSLDETRLRFLIMVLSGRSNFLGEANSLIPLAYDEKPYKWYNVKISEPPQIKYISFLEEAIDVTGETRLMRIYKGEGTLQLIAYDPFARCGHGENSGKFLDEYDLEDYPTKDEWAGASFLAPTQGEYDVVGAPTIKIYNPGDVETDFKAYLPFTLLPNFSAPSSIILKQNGKENKILNFPGIQRQGEDLGICINSKTNLIEGYDIHLNSTGSLYNKFITSGDFFKIPVTTEKNYQMEVVGSLFKELIYDYLYF